MLHFEREVKDIQCIEAMLKMFHHVNLGLNDEDGYPYVVPLNFGFEIKDNKLFVYTHFMKQGHKLDLMRKNSKVCLEFSIFNDFKGYKYKGHYHDYRSIIAKGIIRIVDVNEDYETFLKGYNLLYRCNDREIKPLEERPHLPPMYIGVIECDLKDVTAKAEFPIRSVEDVPFLDVFSLEKDETPFDISDIIALRRKEMKES